LSHSRRCAEREIGDEIMALFVKLLLADIGIKMLVGDISRPRL